MGALFGYFAAADDDDALGAVVRDDDEPFGTGYDGTVVKGLDPVVALGPAEELLTGRSAAELRADPRCGGLVGTSEDGEALVLSLSDALRDALARCGDAAPAEVAARWAATDGLFPGVPDPEHLADFLRELAALAARAAARGGRLYCWVCP
ncbi:hypothetical protein [Kitasatospora cheerisanensis]|uniref:DUF1877 domain-containing protein n=1 Tax=Kitasatospora cheerisanensis KCTC 2395 TaxID=1348663 RepID=A0A066YHJ7_9ACTN|nr:hypothetical protein [Kitasatospora cheerisanensis]KDN80973.1 hypothetical protein KCH_73260 [Kitasatospora cheerisanensis KCTC 2395]